MNFASTPEFTAGAGFFYMPQIWDMGQIPSERRHAEDFYI
jgi:hypothetical protein